MLLREAYALTGLFFFSFLQMLPCNLCRSKFTIVCKLSSPAIFCILFSCFPTLHQYLLPWLSVCHLGGWVMWFLHSSVCQLAEACAKENPSCVAVCQSWLEAFPNFFHCPLLLLSLVEKEIKKYMNPPAIIPLDMWSLHLCLLIYILCLGFVCVFFF